MILYHFQDDLDKAEELLCLITTNFTNEEVDKMNSYEKEIYAKDQEITRITEEKDQEISKKDEEITKLTEDLRCRFIKVLLARIEYANFINSL